MINIHPWPHSSFREKCVFTTTSSTPCLSWQHQQQTATNFVTPSSRRVEQTLHVFRILQIHRRSQLDLLPNYTVITKAIPGRVSSGITSTRDLEKRVMYLTMEETNRSLTLRMQPTVMKVSYRSVGMIKMWQECEVSFVFCLGEETSRFASLKVMTTSLTSSIYLIRSF